MNQMYKPITLQVFPHPGKCCNCHEPRNWTYQLSIADADMGICFDCGRELLMQVVDELTNKPSDELIACLRRQDEQEGGVK